MTYQEYQEKSTALYGLRSARIALDKYYPTMDLTDIDLMIQSLEDDVEGDGA